MKQNVSPPIIIIALVLVAAVVYGIYRASFAPRPNNVKPDNRPAYTKGQGMPGYGQMQGGGGGGPMGMGPAGTPRAAGQ